jgi:hypothetical protein
LRTAGVSGTLADRTPCCAPMPRDPILADGSMAAGWWARSRLIARELTPDSKALASISDSGSPGESGRVRQADIGPGPGGRPGPNRGREPDFRVGAALFGQDPIGSRPGPAQPSPAPAARSADLKRYAPPSDGHSKLVARRLPRCAVSRRAAAPHRCARQGVAHAVRTRRGEEGDCTGGGGV